MKIRRIDHYTLRVPTARLPEVLSFYTRSLSLVEGPRPGFDFDGHWLYADGVAVVHLAGGAPESPAAERAASTGRLDHVSFWTEDLDGTRRRLSDRGVAFREAPVPGRALHQVFLRDPVGLQVELTFATDAAAEPAPGP